MDLSPVIENLRLGIDCAIHKKVMGEVEKELIFQVLKECKYNQSRASEILGISRCTLLYKMRRYFGDEFNRNS